MHDFWPACGYAHLTHDAGGWLQPGDDYLRHLLARPELALVDESCRAERALHRRLQDSPSRAVPGPELAALRDPDARANYGHFLAFRDALRAAGTLEAWTLQLFRSGSITLPPLFIDLVVQAIVRHLLRDADDAVEVRAAELLFRPQRLTLQDGRVLAGDREILDRQKQTRGLGELGRLLAEAQAPVKGLDLRVLGEDNAAAYWAEAALPPGPDGAVAGRGFLLDLTHEITRDVGHGIHFTMTPARGGLKALARVLQRWVRHLLGVAVDIDPVPRIDDAQWRWHVGLDADASALLNDLYAGAEAEPERLKRLVSLFRLRFENPAEMRRDVAGKVVYLGLMANADRVVRLKPQNLLLNLPLATAS